MHEHALLIDFGSTYTKLRAVDLVTRQIVASGQGPSTVTTDVTIGLDMAFRDLENRMGSLPRFSVRLASSSAAGGLRMVTVGLVKELTAEAARQAALGAGAKLVGSFSGKLSRNDLSHIRELSPDILILAGGTDGGNEEVITFNAHAISKVAFDCPVVAAGNRAAMDEVEDVLKSGGKSVVVAGNVMPEFGVLDIDSARAAIRTIFMERIVHAKGIDRAADRFDKVMMPTPAAVLEGAQLIAEGLPGRAGQGDLVVFDVGGATTDVHSICSGAPANADVVVVGLPEPFVKRTVEGDLGMRHNARSIVEMAGRDEIVAEAELADGRLDVLLREIEANVERLPGTACEQRLDRTLARAAVRTAARRHAGTREIAHTSHGPVVVQRGKDLSRVSSIIGTGGPIVHAEDPRFILEPAVASEGTGASLLPLAPNFYLDRAYALYAVGLLAQVDKAAALDLAEHHIVQLN